MLTDTLTNAVKVMAIEGKTSNKQNWIHPEQDMGPNSTINTPMRLSVRHFFSNE